MVEVPTRKLRDFIATLPNGGSAGAVTQGLTIRNDFVTVAQAIPAGGTTGQVLSKVSNTNFDTAWIAAGAGDMVKAVYDPQNKNADAFARANHTGTQSVSTITGLATVATSGSYVDLTNKPTFMAPRSVSAATTPTLTPNVGLYDLVSLTAQTTALAIAAPTGSPVDGQILTIRFRDNGVSRAITWDGIYSAYSSDLPVSTPVNMTAVFRFMYNTSTSKWDLFSGNPIPGKFG